MNKNGMSATGAAARAFLRNWQVMAVFAGLYSSLLAALYLFVATKEASVWQVLLTLALAVTAPVLFFLLQAMGISYAQGETRVNTLLWRSLCGFWKLVLVSLPLILLAWLIFHLPGELRSQGAAQDAGAAMHAALTTSSAPTPDSAQPSLWSAVALVSLRFILLGVVLPLAAIHLWIMTAREGLSAALKKGGRVMAQALAPRSVLIYTTGLLAFGLVPYLLLFTQTPARRPWVELGLLSARLLLAFVFTLFGWVLTLVALARTSVVGEGSGALDGRLYSND